MARGGSSGKGSNSASWTTVLALVSQLGFSIACPMVIFIGGGAWLDSKLGWTPWLLLLGMILGIGTAGAAFYQIATLTTRKRPAKDGTPAVPYKVEQTGRPSDRALGKPPGNRPDDNGHQT